MSASIILTIVCITFVLCGALIGLLRGFHKSWIRIIWLVLSVVLALILTGVLADKLLSIKLGFLKFDGKAQSISEFIRNSVTEEAGLTGAEALALIDYVTKVACMVVGGIVFLALYLVLKILTLILFWIVNAIIKVKKWSKGPLRPLGFLVGAISGFLSFAICFIPISGYINVVSKVDGKIGSYQEEVSDDEIFTFFEEYEDSGVVKLLKGTGLYYLQIKIFESSTTVKINDRKLSLLEEGENMGALLDALSYLMSVDYEKVFNGEVELDTEKVATELTVFLESNLIQAGVDVVKPILYRFIDTYAGDLKNSLSKVMDDVLATLDKIEQIDFESISLLVDGTLSVIQKISDIDVENLTAFDYQGLGADLDKIIESGYVSNQTVGAVFATVVGVAFDSLAEEDKLNSILENITTSIENGVTDYEKEFEAFAKLVTICDITDDGFELSEDAKELGKILDQTIAVNATVLNEELISEIVVDLIDSFTQEISTENAMHSVIGDVKTAVQNGGLTYEKEFEAFAKMVEIAEDLDANFDFKTQGKELGLKIDQTLALNAEIVDKDLINDFIESALNNEEIISLTGDYENSVQTITSRLSDINSYEEEFGYIQTLLEIATVDLSIENINQPYLWSDGNLTIGQKLDQIAPSVLCGDIPLTVIDRVLDNYKTTEIAHAEIINIVSENYNGVKENMAICGNAGTHTYSDLTSAFSELYQSITTTDKITDNSETFDSSIAESYELTLDTLQGNILVQANGARAIAENVARSVKTYIENKQAELEENYVGAGAVLDGAVAYITNYINYLSRDNATGQEPFVGETNQFESEYGNIRVNKPFSYVFDLIEENLP